MDIIRVNLPYLVQKTGNLPILIDNLFASKVISGYENELINSKATLTEKTAELYQIVMSKQDDTIGKLIQCLKRSENQHIADVLEGQPIEDNSMKITNHPIWFEIRPTVPNYSGREIELQELKTSWQTSRYTNDLKFNLISGLGGVGKSELSRIFISDSYLSEKGVNCMWMNSETDSSLIESVKRLAVQIGMSIFDHSGKEKEVSIIISNLFEFVRMKNVIIVFDNLEEITTVFKIFSKEIEKLVLLGPKETKPFVIITTRFQILQYQLSGNVKLIEVEALTPSDALTFLTKSLKIQGHDQDAVLQELASRLQYFPLDLHQAVGFIHSQNSRTVKLSGCPFGVKEYLELFDTERKDLLDYKGISTTELNRRSLVTYVNWRVTKQKLSQLLNIGRICITVMNVLSVLSPNDSQVIFLTDMTSRYLGKRHKPECLLTRIKRIVLRNQISVSESVTDTLIEDAILLCSKYSLFSLKNGVIYVHRLVQEVVRVDLACAGRLENEVISVLVSCFEDKFLSKSKTKNYIQHAIQLWEHISNDPRQVLKYKYFPQEIFNELQYDIKYSECNSFALKAIQVLRSVLEENEVTLELMNSRCVVLVKNGKYDEALISYREVFDKRKILLGTEHQDTLWSEYGIGEVLFWQEDYVEALGVLRTVMNNQERVLGKEHTNTVTTKNLIAMVLQRQGKNDEALLIYREIVSIRENVLGMEHRDTLAAKNNMAFVLYSQGKYSKALLIYYEINEIRERVLGCDHPSTLIGSYNIATAVHKMGENSQALTLLRGVYEKQKLVLGVDHPDTLDTKCWIDNVNAAVNKID